MAAKVSVWVNGQRMATTYKAFSLTAHNELMRQRTLEFVVDNTDNARQYVIDDNAIYEYKGQKYDMITYEQSSGTGNTTKAKGVHVLLHAKNYTVPAGYSTVGTLSEIINDMLSVSGGNAEFSIGTCADVGTQSFTINSTKAVDLYSAIYALTRLGCEIYYDNFIINAPVRIGADTGKNFEIGRDLNTLGRKYDKTTNPITKSYSMSIANLQRLPGGSLGDEFSLGDTVGIKDKLIGDEITGERIVTYDEHDNPALDSVVIGQWVSDLSDTVTTMQVNIESATETANNSVQQGESYNNVSIDHTHGFMSVSADGTSRKFDNGTDGYIIQVLHNGNWVTVYEANKGADGAGLITTYNLEHTQKVVQGGSVGLAMYQMIDGEWKLTGGMDTDGTTMASKLTTPGSSTYGFVGRDEFGYGGLFLYYNGNRYCAINPQTGGGVVLLSGSEESASFESDGIHDKRRRSGDHHVPSDGTYVGYTMHFVDGIYTGWTSD